MPDRLEKVVMRLELVKVKTEMIPDNWTLDEVEVSPVPPHLFKTKFEIRGEVEGSHPFIGDWLDQIPVAVRAAFHAIKEGDQVVVKDFAEEGGACADRH